MQIEKDKIKLGGMTAITGILVLIFGIFMFNPSVDMGYFGLNAIKDWGEMFPDFTFMQVLTFITPVAVFAVAIANIILGILNLFGVLKSDVVFKVMGIVLAGLVVLQLVSTICATTNKPWNEILIFGFWFILGISICGAVWTFVRNKVAK